MSSEGVASPQSAIDLGLDSPIAHGLLTDSHNGKQESVTPSRSATKKPFLKRGSRMPISKIPSDPFLPVVQPIKNPPRAARASSVNRDSQESSQGIQESATSSNFVSTSRPPLPRVVNRVPPPRLADENSWEQVAEKQSEELESFLKDMSASKHVSDTSSFGVDSPRMGSLMKKVFSGGSPRVPTSSSRRRQKASVPLVQRGDTADSLIYPSNSRSVRTNVSSTSTADDVTVRDRIHQLDLQIEKFRKENEYCKKLRLERETALSEANRYKERALQELEAAEKEIEEEKSQLAAEKRRFLQEKDRGRSISSQLRELTDENKILREKMSEMESDFSGKQKKLKNEITRLNSLLSDASRTKYELELEVKALSASQLISATSKIGNKSPDKLIREEISGESVCEQKHADGRIDRTFLDGKREAVFPSGLRKTINPDGSAIVHFPNGDVKETSENNVVIYHYFSTGCVQTTYPDGLEVLQFASGQVEKHFPDGTKEITFPNKLVKRIGRDGAELSGKI
jgi:hypothetical protein